MITNSYQKTAENEHEHFKNLINNDTEMLQKKLKLKLSTNDISESKSDPKCIAYEPTAIDEKGLSAPC